MAMNTPTYTVKLEENSVALIVRIPVGALARRVLRDKILDPVHYPPRLDFDLLAALLPGIGR